MGELAALLGWLGLFAFAYLSWRVRKWEQSWKKAARKAVRSEQRLARALVAGMRPCCHTCKGPQTLGFRRPSWECCKCGNHNAVSQDICTGVASDGGPCAHDPHIDWASFVAEAEAQDRS